RELAPFAPAWLEEPVPPENLKALEKVAAKVDMPVATGERIHDRIEFRELTESQAADVLQPDVDQIGVIWETRKLAATAETHCMLVARHNVGGPVLTAASLQVGFTTPNFKILEHFNDFADAEIKKVVRGAPQVDPEDGCFHLSHEPGLGVELDVDAAAVFPQQQARFDLWAEGWVQRRPKGTA